MTTRVYIGVGSNLGDRAAHLRAALAAVRAEIDSGATLSTIFETEPRLDEEQPPFLNAVIGAQTDLAPQALLDALLGMERSLGRRRDLDRPKGPRTIDMDVLVFGEQIVDTARLSIPHPGLRDRRFVLAPLASMAPELVIPGLGSVRSLLSACPDDGWVRPLVTAQPTGALLACLLVFLVLAAACDIRPPVQRAAGVDFDQAVHAPFRAPERPASVAPTDTGKDNEVIDILIDKRKEVFQRPESTVLTQAEALAARAGRQFDMIDLYRKTYDERGPGHYVAPRLAYAYINIGLNDAARKIVDKMLIARPNDWRTHFIHGWLRGTENKDAEGAIVETLDAWQKALDLGVKDQELYGVSPAFIQKRVTDARAMLERAGKSPTSQPAQPKAPSDPLASADALLSSGQAKAAFMSYSRISEADPKNHRAAVGRAIAGWEAVGGDDPAAGLGLLDKVAERQDLTAVELDRLGKTFLEGPKDKERAKSTWARLLAQFPDYAASVKLKERLEGL
jgi:2-amino-4-hydroxy-6-hydroxymethyldihydropteridine diphosphokinase